MLPQMTEFRSCLWLNNISVCIHPILSNCIPLLWMDTLVELHCLYPFTVDGYLGWDVLSNHIPSLLMDTLVELHCLTVSLHCGWIPWLSCILAAVNSTAANMGVQGAFHLLILFSLSSCWVLQLYDQFIALWGYITVFSTMAVLIYNPINNTWEFLCTQYLIKLFFYFLIIFTLTGVSWYLIIVW